jgi:photosystem II stability/assembly factor-like uncharacterized protein
MKNRTLILLLICFHTMNSNAQWQWRHPLPQGNPLYSISFVDDHTGFAVGACGTILKTTNGGETWTITENQGSCELYKSHFPTGSTGYTIGSDYRAYPVSHNKLILKTTDGGSHWFTVFHNDMKKFNSLWFTSETTGYTAGNDGIIRKATDGGLTWWNYFTPPGADLNDIAFFDSLTGIAIGYNGVLVRTTDGGSNWLVSPLNLPNTTLRSISITGPSSAFVCVDGTSQNPVFLLKTDDGGQSWQGKLDSLPGYPYLICGHFPCQDTGFICMNYDKLLRTTDGSFSWDTVHLPFQATDVHFINGRTGFAITGDIYGNTSASSDIWKTTDGGVSWYLTTPRTTIAHLYQIEFPTRNIGYAIGSDPQGDILKSTDGGKSWFRPGQGPWNGTYFTASFFLNDQVGYIGGSNSTVWKTSDGGVNWDSLTSGGGEICRSIFFLNNDTGYAIYNSNVFYHTYDGGKHWEGWNVVYMDDLNSLQFLTKDTCYVIGNFNSESYVMRSAGGGVYWNKMLTLNNRFIKLQFFNTHEGYALTKWMLYRTMDGGVTWTSDPVPGSYNDFYDMRFWDPENGYLVGSGGLIVKTTDGGKSWTKMESGTWNDLFSVFLFSRDTLIVAGAYSTILSCESGPNPGIQDVNPGVSARFSQCFPNPATTQFNISFDLPRESRVDIRVFDTWGREVRNFSSLRMPPGKHAILFESGSISAGLYYYSIRADGMHETRKIIILD